MRLLSLRVAHFRGIESQAVEFRPTGITVIQGPNEVGKTSLMKAFDILIEFPDSSQHSEVESTKTAGQDAPSEIEARFEIGGETLTYFKRYHRDKATRLTVDSAKPRSLAGREAHDYVKHMLETRMDWELWTALKIDQSTPPDATAKVELVRSTSLREALDRAAGGRAKQVDDSLFHRVHKEWAGYFTPKGKELRPVFDTPRALVTSMAERSEDLKRQIAQAERDAERVEQIQSEIADLADQRAEAEKELRAIERDLENVRQIEASYRLALETQSQVQTKLVALQEQWRERQALLQNESARTAKLRQIEQRRREAETELIDAEKSLSAVRRDLGQAKQAVEQARGIFQQRQEDADIFVERTALSDLEQTVDRISQLRQHQAAWTEELSRIAVTDQVIQEIRAQSQKVNAAQAALVVGTPSAVVRALGEVTVAINGEAVKLDKDQERTLSITERAAVAVPGVAEVAIWPGASASDLRTKRDAELQAEGELLKQHGASSRDDAEDQWRRQQDLARKLHESGEELQRELAGGALSSLEQRLNELRQRVTNYRQRREAEYVFPTTVEEARAAAASAQQALGAVEERSTEMTLMLHAAVARVASLNGELETLASEALAESSHLETARHELIGRRSDISDEDLTRELETTTSELQQAQHHADALKHQLDALEPVQTRIRAEQKRGELDRTVAYSTQLAAQAAELRGGLSVIGARGLSEEREQVEADLHKARNELSALERRAQAAKTLFEVLRSCRDEEQSRYREPLRKQIGQIGQIVFGSDFDVQLNDSLMVESRKLNGLWLSVDALSTGAKEQLALLARLAAASLVDPAEGVPVILDDTLGHSDDHRLDLMAAVLGRVAKTNQIILLTSAARRYTKIAGAHVVDLWRPAAGVPRSDTASGLS